MIYQGKNTEELSAILEAERKKYEEIKKKGINLDVSRGKPHFSQLDISKELLNMPISGISESGIDCRNYGVIDGIPEIKNLFAELLEVSPSEIFVGGNSSLNLMYDLITKFIIFGTGEGAEPWKSSEEIKFLCPAPGYDRHFAITEGFGFKMIPVRMNENGPDMDEVERLVSEDSSIKGIWCVPMYSNPQGITYSDETVRRFAALKPAASDFRIFWDNAYFVHHLTDTPDKLLNILEECKKTGREDSVFIFASTSKISFPGAGVSVMASSEKNIKYLIGLIGAQTIGYDKLNQLRHAAFFKSASDVHNHMKLHRDIMYPKFEIIEKALDEGLFSEGLITYHKPNGGYFISVDTTVASAKRVVKLCLEAGLKLTPAGSSYPYHIDPDDSNIRLAPTFIGIESLSEFGELFSTAVRISSLEKLIMKN